MSAENRRKMGKAEWTLKKRRFSRRRWPRMASEFNDDVARARVIEQSSLPENAKTAGVLGALMGVPTESIIKGMVAVMSTDETRKSETEHPLKPVKGRYNKTEEKLIEMLTENTGASILDNSGYTGGRNWEKNRSITDWKKMPETEAKVWVSSDGQWSIDLARNVFPFLANRLRLDADTTKFNGLLKSFAKKNPDLWGLSLAEGFAEYLRDEQGVEVHGSFNTYNGESTLKQVLQGVTFVTDDNPFVILQIHGGADVRGGYTEPFIFKCEGEEAEFLFDDHDVSAQCKCTGVSSDDCGYHWYPSFSPEDDNEKLDQHGFDPKLAPREEQYKLPKSWQPKVMESGSSLVCTRCDGGVDFS